jgi:hypothetical protein
MQIEQQTHILSAEQVLKAEVLQQTDRDLELFGQQRLLERALPVLLGGEPLTGTPMPGTPRRPCSSRIPGRVARTLAASRANPPGFDKTHVLQGVQPLRSLTGAKQMLAQPALNRGRCQIARLQQFRRQGVEQFMLQVVETASPIALLVLPGHPLTTIEQGNARAGAPATAALDDLPAVIAACSGATWTSNCSMSDSLAPARAPRTRTTASSSNNRGQLHDGRRREPNHQFNSGFLTASKRSSKRSSSGLGTRQ